MLIWKKAQDNQLWFGLKEIMEEMPDIRDNRLNHGNEPGIKFKYRPVWRFKQRLNRLWSNVKNFTSATYIVFLMFIYHILNKK